MSNLQITFYQVITWVFRILGMLSVVFLLLSLLRIWKSIKKAEEFKLKRLVVGIVLSAASLGIFLYLSKITVSQGNYLLYGGLGLMVGVVWAFTVRIYSQDGKVMTRNSIWYLFIWGVSLGIAQVFKLIGQQYLNTAIFSSILSFGIVFGMNALMAWQYRGVKMDLQKQQSKQG